MESSRKLTYNLAHRRVQPRQMAHIIAGHQQKVIRQKLHAPHIVQRFHAVHLGALVVIEVHPILLGRRVHRFHVQPGHVHHLLHHVHLAVQPLRDPVEGGHMPFAATDQQMAAVFRVSHAIRPEVQLQIEMLGLGGDVDVVDDLLLRVLGRADALFGLDVAVLLVQQQLCAGRLFGGELVVDVLAPVFVLEVIGFDASAGYFVAACKRNAVNGRNKSELVQHHSEKNFNCFLLPLTSMPFHSRRVDFQLHFLVVASHGSLEAIAFVESICALLEPVASVVAKLAMEAAGPRVHLYHLTIETVRVGLDRWLTVTAASPEISGWRLFHGLHLFGTHFFPAYRLVRLVFF